MMRTSPQPGPMQNPFALGNIRRFLAFRHTQVFDVGSLGEIHRLTIH